MDVLVAVESKNRKRDGRQIGASNLQTGGSYILADLVGNLEERNAKDAKAAERRPQGTRFARRRKLRPPRRRRASKTGIGRARRRRISRAALAQAAAVAPVGRRRANTKNIVTAVMEVESRNV